MRREDFTMLPYRPCVGLMVLNADGLVFSGRRLDNDTDAWQMPQGGVDPGETEQVAALRELEEEIGLNASQVRILDQAPELVHYDLPLSVAAKLWRGRYRGQSQRWFALRLLTDDAAINIATKHPEFSEWRWMRAPDLLNAIVPFKRDAYEKVFAMFDGLLTK